MNEASKNEFSTESTEAGGATRPPTRRRFQPNSPRPGDQRREALLDNLEVLLRKASPSDLTMEMIASAASLSRTSVYFYFENKTDAIDALIARASDEMLTRVYDRTSDESLREFVTRLIAAALDGWRRHRPTFVAAVDLASHTNEATTRWRAVMRVFVQCLVDALLQENENPTSGKTVGEAEAEQRAEIVCWMIERNFYFLFAREHEEAEEETLATALEDAAFAVLTMDASPR